MTDKIITTIHRLKHDFESDWRNDLEIIGIWSHVKPLYNEFANWTANVILAFVVLAYHRQSGMINLDHDRIQNKIQIMEDLGGVGAMMEQELEGAVMGTCDTTMIVIRWLMDYQKDWRWLTIEQCFSFHSQIMHSPHGEDPKKRGQALSEAIDKRKEGEKLLAEIQNDYVKVDTLLQQEGLPKLTEEPSGHCSWEEWLRKRKNKEFQTSDNELD